MNATKGRMRLIFDSFALSFFYWLQPVKLPHSRRMWLMEDLLPARGNSAALAISGILLFIVVVETIWLRLLRWAHWPRSLLFAFLGNACSIAAIILLATFYKALFSLSFLTVFTIIVVLSVLVEGLVLAAAQRFKNVLNAFLASLAANCASFLLLYLTLEFLLH
jgi:hypothetical protein